MDEVGVEGVDIDGVDGVDADNGDVGVGGIDVGKDGCRDRCMCRCYTCRHR